MEYYADESGFTLQYGGGGAWGGTGLNSPSPITFSCASGYVTPLSPKGPTMPEIGNDVSCHLCGAPAVTRSTYSRRKKDGLWKTSISVTYACDTWALTRRNGRTRVYLGARCIHIPAAGE